MYNVISGKMKKNNKALLNTIFANNKNYGIITGNLNLANELVEELTKKSLFKKENSKKIGYLAEVEPTKQLIIDTLDNKEDAKFLAKFLKLDLNKPVNSLNLNNLKKLKIIKSLINKPEMLILNEPFLDLDPLIKNDLINLLKSYAQEHKIIIITHDLAIKEIVDYIIIIQNDQTIEYLAKETLNKSKFLIVDLVIENVKKITFPLKNMQIRNFTNDEVNFIYKGSIEELTKALASLDIKKILITEPTIEDLLLYYKDVERGSKI